MRSLICTHPNAAMEILGLAPTNPRHNTSAPMAELSLIGNIVEMRFHYISSTFPLYFQLSLVPVVQVEIDRKCISCLFPLPEINIPNRDRVMPGKPHQSVLVPYEQEIIALRHRRPPTPYYRISEVLKERHGISVQAPAICKFIKVRAGGRKVFSYGRNTQTIPPPVIKPMTTSSSLTPVRAASNTPVVKPVTPPPVSSVSKPNQKPFTRFEYKYSENYNLHRLTPEEAEALRKKIREENQ